MENKIMWDITLLYDWSLSPWEDIIKNDVKKKVRNCQYSLRMYRDLESVNCYTVRV